MPKLKVAVGRWGKTVLVTIVEQNESLRMESRDCDKVPYQTADFRVCSSVSPELESNELFIRGANADADTSRFSCQCVDTLAAEELIRKIRKAVAAINAEPSEPSEPAQLTIPLEIIGG